MVSLLSALLAFVMVFTATGCTEFASSIGLHSEIGDLPSQAVAIIIGAHRNFPAVSLNVSYDYIYDACLSYGDFFCITADGDPFLQASFSITESDKDLSDAKRKQIARENTEQIMAVISQSKAATAQVDPLAALQLAGECLAGSDAEIKKLIVIDSCLGTAGLINYAESNFFDADPASIVQQLSDKQELPRLSGVDIIFQGLGQTAAPQQELPAGSRNKVIALWTAICQASGASVTVDPMPLGSTVRADNDSLPAVDPIPVVVDGLEVNVSGTISCGGILAFHENTVKFIGDTDIFIDPDAACQAMKPVASALAADPTIKIDIFGLTASTGNYAACERLSLLRAIACKNLLVDLGAPSDQIFTFGLGRTANFLRVEDLDINGTLIEDQAKINRAIYIVKRGSETARVLEPLAITQ